MIFVVFLILFQSFSQGLSRFPHSGKMGFTFENNIIYGEKEKWIIKEGGLGKVYFDSMQKFSSRNAQIEALSGESDTYETLLKKSVRVALHLKKLGISRSDVICLWSSNNNLEASVPLIAAQFIGAITYAAEPDQTAEDASILIKQLPPKVIFTTRKLLDKTKQAVAFANVSTKVIVFEEKDYLDVIQKPQSDEKSFAPVYIQDLNETAVYHFTSGSTGTPKIVRQSHYFIFAADGDTAKAMESYDDQETVVYTMANWFWGAATRLLAMALFHGSCRILDDTNEGSEILKNIERYKITHMMAAAPLFYSFDEIPETVKKTDTSTLKVITTVGQAVHAAAVVSVRKMLPHITIFNYYGQSEVGAITMFDVKDEKHKKLMTAKPTSVGLPLEGISYKIVNPDTEEVLGPNQKGEIRLKSKRICNYLNRDPSESIAADGWYKTGDLGYYDDDFCVFIVDRIKDEFKYHMWHISPGYLENIILNHPGVAKVVVVGKPHPVDGALPTALVILKQNAGDVSAEEIIKYVEERVDDRMRLRGGVRFLKSFPLTPTKKVNKIALRKMVEEEDDNHV